LPNTVSHQPFLVLLRLGGDAKRNRTLGVLGVLLGLPGPDQSVEVGLAPALVRGGEEDRGGRAGRGDGRDRARHGEKHGETLQAVDRGVGAKVRNVHRRKIEERKLARRVDHEVVVDQDSVRLEELLEPRGPLLFRQYGVEQHEGAPALLQVARERALLDVRERSLRPGDHKQVAVGRYRARQERGLGDLEVVALEQLPQLRHPVLAGAVGVVLTVAAHEIDLRYLGGNHAKDRRGELLLALEPLQLGWLAHLHPRVVVVGELVGGDVLLPVAGREHTVLAADTELRASCLVRRVWSAVNST
jgi:hypothetical protein